MSGSPTTWTQTLSSGSSGRFWLSARLAGKAALDLGDAVERSLRQCSFFDRARGIFQLLQRRVADQHRRDRRLRRDISDRGFDQAVGMPVADQRHEAAGALDIAAVAA